MTRLAHSYADEIDPRALERARRRIARRDQAHPDWCDITVAHRHVERHEPEPMWPLWKFAVVTFFAIAFIVALVIIAAAGQVPA